MRGARDMVIEMFSWKLVFERGSIFNERQLSFACVIFILSYLIYTLVLIRYRSNLIYSVI